MGLRSGVGILSLETNLIKFNLSVAKTNLLKFNQIPSQYIGIKLHLAQHGLYIACSGKSTEKACKTLIFPIFDKFGLQTAWELFLQMISESVQQDLVVRKTTARARSLPEK